MVIYISNDEMEKCKKIVVVGSTNVDLIARVSHLPEPGETIGDAEYCLSYGGKGANQAIAAARSGGHALLWLQGQIIYCEEKEWILFFQL